MRTAFYISLILAIFFSCAPELPADQQVVVDKEKEYTSNKTKENSAAYIAAVTLYSSKYPRTKETKNMLEKARVYALEQDQSVVATGIQSELIKQFPDDPKRIDRLVSLAKDMDKMGKKKAAQSIKYFLHKSNPSQAAEAGFVIPNRLAADPQQYLQGLAEQIFEKAEVGGLNRQASFDYVDATEAFVMVNPKDEQCSRLLFNAAEISKTIGTFNKSLGLYDWILRNYPQSKQAANSQFLKAFILEDNLKNIEGARVEYEKFIANFPNHHFVDDAKFSLKNLGKSSEDIQAELERLQKEASK